MEASGEELGVDLLEVVRVGARFDERVDGVC